MELASIAGLKMKVKVNEASGVVLDWLVAQCEGFKCRIHDGELQLRSDAGWVPCAPSTNPSQAWAFIERKNIDLYQSTGRKCAAIWENLPGGGRLIAEAKDCPSVLIAACRCYVMSERGEEVEVPDDLHA